MSSENKYKELFNLFETGYNENLTSGYSVSILAKEIIEVIKYFDSQYDSQIFKDEINFWEEVEKEIEKL